MRGAIPKFTAITLLTGAASLFVLGYPAEVRAQFAFCPPPFNLAVNGSCVDPRNGNGAFSGAAVASQALSELSETTTQETTKNTVKSVSERREQEKERCAEGFSRVDGTCKPNPPRESEAAPVVPAGPPEEHALKTTKKAKAAAVSHKEVVAPAPKIVQRAPPPGMVCKDGPCAPPPIPIEPAVRFGTWAHVYGDYEKRDATGTGSLTCCSLAGFAGLLGGVNLPDVLALSVRSRTGTVGFLAGADLTSRGLISANDGLIMGLTAGYVSSDLTLNSSSVSGQAAGNSVARLHATLPGPTAGLYATYFNGGFSTDFILKFDALTLNETFNDLAVTTVQVGGNNVSALFAGGGSVSLLNTTVAGDLNYRFDLYPNFWIEPTVGAHYTNSSYGSNAAQFGLADGNLVMVQGGARIGTTTLIGNSVLMTPTLTGLAYDDVLVAGGFIPAAAFAGQNLLVQADQGKVRGRGILAFNFDCGQGITSFVQGEVRGGSGLFGAGGKAGVRVDW